jgi:hypothetical protein
MIFFLFFFLKTLFCDEKNLVILGPRNFTFLTEFKHEQFLEVLF